MNTFVPDGNKPIKPEVTKKPQQEKTDQTPSGLNPFPGWKRPNDEFVVDL